MDQEKLFESSLSRYFSEEQLQQIRSYTIGIAGAGGLGSNCAANLVRCGFNKFVIVDFDIVEPSNLNRQFYFLEHIGKPKVDCLREQLLRINPHVSVRVIQKRITEECVRDFFVECQVIVEAFDSADAKAMLIGAFFKSDKLVVGASGIGGYGNSDRIVTRQVRANVFIVGDGESEVGEGINPYAPCVSIAAAKEADVVLSWVLHAG